MALVVLLVACNDGAIDYPKRNVPSGVLGSQEVQQAGRELFQEKCSFCHGHIEEGHSPRGNGYDPPPMDFSSPSYRTIDPAYLYWRIEVGKNIEPFLSRGSVMPAWGPHLSEAQIWQLVAYLKSRSR